MGELQDLIQLEAEVAHWKRQAEAVPSLLEALGDLARRAEKIGHNSFRSMFEFDEFVRVVEDAKSAIAKATGDRS